MTKMKRPAFTDAKRGSMSISIAYLFTFLIAMTVLLFMITYGDGYSVNQILLVVVIVVGNAGYFPLSLSDTLPEALLSTTITYVSGCFAPMLMFAIACEIYKVQIPGWILCIMYAVQFGIYCCVMTIGRLDLFYRSAELHRNGDIVYLTKVYGPMHTVEIITMYLYFALLILVSAGVFPHKRRISTADSTAIFFLEFFTISVYIAQRMVGLQVELMPFAFDLGLVLLMIPITKLNTYSITGNNEIIRNRLEQKGYIFFDRKMRFMGCNEKAYEFFPELNEWELERKIPGKGGRFNTYLRQPFAKYLENEDDDLLTGNFLMKNERFFYNIGVIRNKSNRKQGYIIELDNIQGQV